MRFKIWCLSTLIIGSIVSANSVTARDLGKLNTWTVQADNAVKLSCGKDHPNARILSCSQIKSPAGDEVCGTVITGSDCNLNQCDNPNHTNPNAGQKWHSMAVCGEISGD